MTNNEKKIWIKIRAEHIKHWHDNGLNKGKFWDDMPMEEAIEKATNQLESDLRSNNLRISLEELLTLSDDECIEIAQERHYDHIREIINKAMFNNPL